MYKKVLLAASFSVLMGCGNPQNTVIPSDMAKWDTELKPSVEKLDPKDKELFVAYIARTKMSEAFGGSKMAMGTTIGQAIAEQKQWQEEKAKKEAEEKALKEKILAEREAIRKRVDDVLTVSLIKLQMVREDYQKNQEVELAFKNKGEKDILGVQGSIHFINVFDKDVGEIGFSYDDGIKAGATASWFGTRRYNEFIDSHKAIANLEPGKFTTKFVPKMIVFTDGEKIAIEE